MQNSIALKIAVESLVSAQKRFLAEELSPLAHRCEREAAIAAGIEAIAASCGVALQLPLQIDSRGDFSIIAVAGPGKENKGFGKELADLLTAHQVRCGQSPGSHLFPEACWGYLNHFSAEKLVRQVAESQELAESPQHDDLPSDRPTI